MKYQLGLLPVWLAQLVYRDPILISVTKWLELHVLRRGSFNFYGNVRQGWVIFLTLSFAMHEFS